MTTMADTSTVDRSEWAKALDRLTREHEGHLVTIELLDPTYGDLSEAERLPFSYANYDHKDDVVVIGVGGDSPRYPVVLRHIVSHPTEVDVAEEGTMESALKVTDKDGTVTVVGFYPAPGSS
jgi:threonine dehydrogenase-like Zn-dependent dehydrogenase